MNAACFRPHGHAACVLCSKGLHSALGAAACQSDAGAVVKACRGESQPSLWRKNREAVALYARQSASAVVFFTSSITA